METLKKGIAGFAFALALPIMRVIFPMRVYWEDKAATVKALKKGNCVLFSNHRGLVEGLYLTRYLHKYHVFTYVGKDWYDKKAINWLFRNLCYIAVDRKQMDTEWLDKGVTKIKEGNSIYILPEGHTDHGEGMDTFKPGFLVLAKRADSTLVPMYLVDKFRLFHLSTVIIGKPMELDLNEDGRPSIVMKKHSNTCREQVIELGKRYEDGKIR